MSNYITLSTLKNYLGLTGSDEDDVVLEASIDRAQAAIDAYTNRTFEAASDTKHYGWDAVDDLFLWLDAALYSLTSVANGDDSATAVSTDDITLWPRNQGPPYHKLRLDDGSTSTWQVDTDYWIAVTGEWGYSASAPNDIVLATVRWAAYLYEQKDAPYTRVVANIAVGSVEIPATIPEDVRTLLNPYRRMSL